MCHLTLTLCEELPWVMVSHDGVVLKEGPLRENELPLSVRHGPGTFRDVFRTVDVADGDVLVNWGAYTAVGKAANWRHLVRLLRNLVDDEHGSCCVCLMDRPYLVGCHRCTATMCSGCIAQMGVFSNRVGWVARCPQCRAKVVSALQDTPRKYVPWFFRCDGSPESRLMRGLVFGLSLHAAQSGVPCRGFYEFHISDSAKYVQGKLSGAVRMVHDSQDVTHDGRFTVKYSIDGLTRQERVPMDLLQLYGRRNF